MLAFMQSPCIVGLRTPSSGAAALGHAIHAGTAKFDSARLEQRETSIDEAIDAANMVFDEESKKDVVFDEKLTSKEALDYSIRLTARYCQDIAPLREYSAVELLCHALYIMTKHGVVCVTGTTDRIRVLADGSKGIADLKSGGRATEKTEDGRRRAVTKGHHIQLGIYTLMAEQASGERLDAPAEVIGLQTTKETPVATGEVADVKTPLLGSEEHPGMIEIAAGMLKSGIYPPNPKSMLCSEKYCAARAHGKCHYHD
jgi:hypothetical protein